MPWRLHAADTPWPFHFHKFTVDTDAQRVNGTYEPFIHSRQPKFPPLAFLSLELRGKDFETYSKSQLILSIILEVQI